MSSIVECPDRNELELLVTSLDTEAELERLAEHLEHCERCADVVESRLAADTILRSFQTTAPDVPVGDPLVANLMERLSAWGRLRHGPLAETTAALSTSGSGTPPREASDAADFLAPPEMPDELGRLGGYRVLRRLGAGGMGLVFEAEDPKLRRRVALKVMKPALAADESARQRFLHEAQSTAALEHDHIVTVHQVGEDRGLPFLAMPLLKGETLDDRLRRQDAETRRHGDAVIGVSASPPLPLSPSPRPSSSQLPLAEVLRIGREMAAGLAAAHQRGLVHRDVKPSNVWLEGAGGRVKLLDFGLARAITVDATDDAPQLTQQGQIVGTPAYMAPEQAQGRTLDERCDLFSLGCVLYRMTTGQLPFHGTDAVSTLVAISTARPRPPREINPDLPAGLSNLILSLLAKDRAARPASAQAVFEEIERIEAGTNQGNREQGTGNRGGWWRTWAISAAAALILAGIVIVIRNKDGSVAAKIPLQPDQDFVVSDDQASRPTAQVPRREPPGGPAVDVRQPLGNDAAADAAAPNPLDTRALRSFGVLLDELPAEVPLVARLGDPRLGHRWHVTSVAYSPEGTILAAAGADKLIVLHDTTSWRILRTLRGHSSPILALAFHPGGQILASGGSGEVKLWNVDSGEERLSVPGNVVDVRSMVFVRDGTQLAVGSNSTIKLYSVATCELAEELKGHTGSVCGLSLSPDGGRLASCARNDRTIRIWPLTDKKAPFVFEGRAECPDPRAVAFYPDGKKIAVGGWAPVYGYDAETGRFLQEFHPRGVANCLAFSPDGKTLAAGGGQPSGAGGCVDRWDVDSGTSRSTVWLPGWSANSCMFSPDGGQLAVAADGYGAGAFHGEDYFDRQWEETHQVCRAFILDTGDGRLLVPAAGHSAPVSGLAFGPGGEWLASSGYDGKIHLWDIEKLEMTRTFAVPHDDLRLFSNTIQAVAASPDGQWLAGSVGDKEVRVWEVATRGEPLVFEGACFAHGSLDFSPDSRLLAVGGRDHLLRVWDVASGTQRWQLTGRADETRVVAFSPDGRLLASGGKGNGVVNLWDAQPGDEIGTFAGPGGDVVALAFVDNNMLAVGSANGTVKLRAVPSGESPAALRPEEAAGELTALAVPRGGQRLATAHADSTVRVWDIQRRKVARSFPLSAGQRQVFRLAFTPEGRYLAAAMADGTIEMLRLDSTGGPDADQHATDAPAANPLDRRALRSFGFLLDQVPSKAPLVARLGDPRLGHRWELTRVAYSPDGAILAAAGLDKLVVLYDTKTLEVLRTLRGHSSRVTALAFHPDGTIVASGSPSEVKLHDVATGEERLALPGGLAEVEGAMAFVRDGAQLAVATGAAIQLYNVESGRLARELKGHTGPIAAIASSADGLQLASCSGPDHSVRVWSLSEEKEPLVFDHRGGPHALAFHPREKIIAVGGMGQWVGVWDSETGQLLREFAPPDPTPAGAWCTSLAFSLDGQTLAAGGYQPSGAGGFLHRWDAASGAARPAIWVAGQNVNSLAFSPDRHLALATRGYGAGAPKADAEFGSQFEQPHQVNRTVILDAGDGRLLVPAAGHAAPVSGLAFGAGGDWLASGGYDGKINLWDMETLEVTRTFVVPHDDQRLFDNTIMGVAASPDGQWLAGSVGGDKEVRLWDVATPGEPLLLPGACFSHGSMAFSPDSRLLAVGGRDHLLRVWDVASGKERWKLTGRADETRVVAFSPDGRLLASGGKGSGVVNLWDPESRGESGTFAGPGGDVVALDFVDDATLAVGSADGSVRLRAVPSGESLAALRVEEAAGELTALAVPPGGEWLATAHADSTIRVWDIERRKVERSFPLAAGQRQVFRLVFSPEGRYLAAAMADGTINLLRLATAQASGGRKLPGDSASRPASGDTDSTDSGVDAPAASANSPLDAFPLRAKGHALPQIADAVPIVAELGDSRLTRWCRQIDRVVFSPDGTRIAFSGFEEGSISICDATTFEVVHALQAQRGFVLGIAFHPKQNTLASCGADGQVKLWDLEAGQERATLAGDFSVPWGGLVYNPEGTLLAVSADPNVANPTIKICNPATGAVERELADDGAGRGNMAFSPNGKMLVRARQDAIHRWNCDDWSKLEPLEPGIDVRSDVVFSPDGHSLAAPGHSSVVVAWDVDSGKEKRRFIRHPLRAVSTAAYSPDGQTLAAGGMAWDGYQAFVDFWDANDGTHRSTLLLAGHSTALSCVYHRDGTTLAIGTGGQSWGENPGRVFMYDVEQGRMRVPDGSGHTAAVSSLAFTGGGRQLISGSYDHTVRVWDLETLDSVKMLKPRRDPNGLPGLVQAVAASADGDLLASVTHHDGGSKGSWYSVQIWNAETGEELLSLPGGCAVPASLAFSSDGRNLAVGTHDRLVHVWDPASGTERWKLEGHSDQVSAVAFSPDGRTLASGGHDKTVNFWDMETGEKLGTAGGLLDKVVAIDFLGDGRTLAVAGADGTIQWREAPTGRVQGTLAADASFGALTAMGRRARRRRVGRRLRRRERAALERREART